MAHGFKAVLVGCGGISHAWLSAAQHEPDLQIVGLVDLNQAAAEHRANEFKLHNVKIGTGMEEVIRETSPDLVFDCTVPEAHVDVALSAFKHGCHLFSEKPLADSMENARKMVAAAEKAGKLYAIMQNRRYTRPIIPLVEFLRQEKIGKITTVNSDFYIGAHFGGFRDRMQHVLLLDMAIHTFDAARYISGADPVAVYCKEWNPVGSWYDHDASAIAIFEMTNGIILTYRGSWCAEGVNTTWESEWRILGSHGAVWWDGANHFIAEIPKDEPAFIRPCTPAEIPILSPEQLPYEGHFAAMKDFLGCLRTGRTPQTHGKDNIKSLAMVFGAIESAEAGKRVEIFNIEY
jgi:predicted dehydrogenase